MHAPIHRLGAIDPVNVGGLSGVLGDAQRANVLVTPGGDFDLAAATIADGQVFQRVGDTLAGYSLPRHLSQLPNSLHPDNDEFDGPVDVFPSGWGIWRGATNNQNIFSETSLVPADNAPVMGVEPYVQVFASGGDASRTRFNVNSPRRPSWFFFQTGRESGSFRWRLLWAKKLASDLPANFTVIVRFSMLQLPPSIGGGTYQNGGLIFLLAEDAANTPNPTTTANIQFWPNDVVAGYEYQLGGQAKASGLTFREYPGDSRLHVVPEYAMIVRRAGVFHFWASTGLGWSRVASVSGANANGTYRWIGFTTMNRDGGPEVAAYVGCDWFRRWDGTEAVL